MQPVLVRLPSGARYWTVLDEELNVVAKADAFPDASRVGSLMRVISLQYWRVSPLRMSYNA